MAEPIVLIVFNLLVLAVLVLDAKVFHRKTHEAGILEAFIWTCVWLTLALLLKQYVSILFGEGESIEFLSCYLTAGALSLDSIFVIFGIFALFHVPRNRQYNILFWCILVALLVRVVFMQAGIWFVPRLHWFTYVLGTFLVFAGIRMLKARTLVPEPEQNPKRQVQVIVSVILIIIADVVFAADSISAGFAVTQHSFMVHTANVFAILLLRSLYFLLAGIEKHLRYMKHGVFVILILAGLKMLISDFYPISFYLWWMVVVGVLVISVVSSVVPQGK